MTDKTCHCYGCGRNQGVDSSELPCLALQGWFIVSHLVGPEDIKRYGFCSLECLQRWVNENAEAIPEIFLNSFDEL
ncbi:hypothetical protein [Dehalogenimonas formicexedens]|nr:hypothetical protein [Dehalogenimonas formicexedens]